MKPSHPADSHPAPAQYAPSVPMSVYRELASELRANKAVIDSLNSRNQQLLQQNQFLKQEIHNVVQSALSLGQAAGVARPAPQSMGNSEPISSMQYSTSRFPNAIAPDTLAQLAQSEAGTAPLESAYEQRTASSTDRNRADRNRVPNFESGLSHNRVPRPIAPATHKPAPKTSAKAAGQKPAKPKSDKSAARQNSTAARAQATQAVGRRTEAPSAKRSLSKPKLFTEQSGAFRSSALESQENKEISGIWLVLSIILIVVTAFGAGFLIMKPLLNER